MRAGYFVRDMVESHELVVPFVRTAENWADFFTKDLPAPQFFALRALIMNEPAVFRPKPKRAPA